MGDSGHELVLKDFRELIPTLEKKLKKRGIPGVFLDAPAASLLKRS
jgi:hypothetical protein